jgi:hypothetical protein
MLLLLTEFTDRELIVSFPCGGIARLDGRNILQTALCS